MATWYVNSAATGTGAGTSWVNACTTLAAAIALSAAGDDFNVLSTHSESMNGVTLNFKGTVAAPNRVFSCGNTNSPAQASDLLPGATFSNTNGSNFFWAGYAYFYGLTINHVGASGSFFPGYGGYAVKFDTCALNAGVSPGFNGVAATGLFEFVNCTFGNVVSGASQFISFSGQIVCTNCTWSWAPLNLVNATINGGEVRFDGCDLSTFGSGKTLVGAGAGSLADVIFINCKLGASVAVAATPTAPQSERVDLVSCDSGATGNRTERYRYQGTLSTDTTDIRAGGASDGVSPSAWKVITTANALRQSPFECFEIAKWCGVLGSPITVQIPIMSNATLTNADIWPEVEYLGSAAAPIASLASGAPATQLTAGSAWPTDGVSIWTTTGVTGPVQQMMSVTFTPQMAGFVRVKIKVAKPSQTVRIDPLLQGF